MIITRQISDGRNARTVKIIGKYEKKENKFSIFKIISRTTNHTIFQCFHKLPLKNNDKVYVLKVSAFYSNCFSLNLAIEKNVGMLFGADDKILLPNTQCHSNIA